MYVPLFIKLLSLFSVYLQTVSVLFHETMIRTEITCVEIPFLNSSFSPSSYREKMRWGRGCEDPN